MIEAHAFDAWTLPAVRKSTTYGWAMILAGFAAPLFLWLAGIAVPLAAARAESRSSSRREAVNVICRRGLELFVLGFLFRLQAFAVSPGSHPVTLFRVDILNIMGPAIVLAGLMWGLVEDRRLLVGVYAISAAGIATLTPVVRATAAVDSLPTWVQWYIRPAGEHTTFTAFPWVGFVLAGAACGVLLESESAPSSERRLHPWLAIGGLVLLVGGLYAATLPSFYKQSSFWTSSPTYFAVRVGVIMLAFSALYFLGDIAERIGVLRPLERLGRSSLFVYWIHVELVYGYATWPIRQRLPLWGTTIAFAVFVTLMFGVIVVRDHIVELWRGRGGFPQPAGSAGRT